VRQILALVASIALAVCSIQSGVQLKIVRVVDRAVNYSQWTYHLKRSKK
jgi:hypothetical protein